MNFCLHGTFTMAMRLLLSFIDFPVLYQKLDDCHQPPHSSDLVPCDFFLHLEIEIGAERTSFLSPLMTQKNWSDIAGYFKRKGQYSES